jgi:putative hemolysin
MLRICSPRLAKIRQISNFAIKSGRTSVDDLNDEFELDLPEEDDYETIGGFVFSRLGYIPKTGETFEYKDMTFEITSAEARKIRRIKIRKNPQQ